MLQTSRMLSYQNGTFLSNTYTPVPLNRQFCITNSYIDQVFPPTSGIYQKCPKYTIDFMYIRLLPETSPISLTGQTDTMAVTDIMLQVSKDVSIIIVKNIFLSWSKLSLRNLVIYNVTYRCKSVFECCSLGFS